MTSTSCSGRHLPYAHILTSFFEEIKVDPYLGGRPFLRHHPHRHGRSKDNEVPLHRHGAVMDS
ncbi:hypothetical protein Scep_004576 [Stephania cephalantha]|uniref:Uncharacterized protein n=1 Tax=Stephania cephalantha TaxID=152367 RepID=A0AAP0PVH6_9MAGN